MSTLSFLYKLFMDKTLSLQEQNFCSRRILGLHLSHKLVENTEELQMLRSTLPSWIKWLPFFMDLSNFLKL